MSKLPKKIISLKNRDKTWHEKWTETRDPLNFPHPTRLLAFGRPNSGKSTVIKNILIRADPIFKKIYLFHCDGENTKEYSDIDVEVLNELPEPYDVEVFDGKTKTLLIIDDVEFRYMSKAQLRRLDRLYGYTSTHRNLSIFCCVQDLFSLVPCIRRMSNVFICWKCLDTDLAGTIARRMGLKKKEFEHIVRTHLKSFHDSLWIDTTDGSPYPLRISGYQMLEKTDLNL